MPKQKKQESSSILDSGGWINLASTIATAAVSVVVLVYTVNHGVTAKLDEMQRTLGDRITIMRVDCQEHRQEHRGNQGKRQEDRRPP